MQFNIVLVVSRIRAQPITLHTTHRMFQNYCYMFKTLKYGSWLNFARY
jgi:hypothetical protein